MATEPEKAQSSSNGKALFFKDNLPGAAQFYIALVILLGVPVLLVSIYHSLIHQNLNWLYLAALTAVASLFAVRIPILDVKSQSLVISVSDVFVFVALLVFCPQVATTIAGVEVLIAGLRCPIKRLYKRLFNFAELPLATFLTGSFFYWMRGTPVALGADQSSDFGILILQVLAAGLAYFLLNTGVVAMALALVSRGSFFIIWKRNFASLSLANLVNEATAVIIFAFLKPVNVVIVATIIPLALVVYYVRKISIYRTHQAGNAQVG
ncbi:MAG TPA: hypothetical protein VGK99_14425 [Acidobacteriota bacterium]|jgi:hypothetical protein